MLLKPEKIFANKSIKSTNQINQIENDQEKTFQGKNIHKYKFRKFKRKFKKNVKTTKVQNS